MIIAIVLIIALLGLRQNYAQELKHIDVTDLKELMTPYSGYNQGAYVEYINNIQLMANSIENEYVAREFLANAERNIDDISFNADFRQDEIYYIKKHIVAEANSLILIYLNN